MAAALASLLSLVLLHTSTSTSTSSTSSSSSAAAATLESAPERASPSAKPHLTDCVSRNMETFRCRWNAGDGSEPADLGLFYMNKKSPHASPQSWSECPDYSSDRPNECFFNENHTTIWTPYIVQLTSRDRSVLYDEKLFLVQEIVQPDPPVGVNWTLLNVSVTSSFYDVLLSWRPPQSADVETGWMRLEYEVQYRDVSSESWKVINSLKNTHSSLYGLQTNVNHEVRVRCKMVGQAEFGEFSESVFIHVAKVSRFPVVALLLFGALCLVAILMLFIISQQQRLMVILLPPVPGPKIRGIDPELLKKGKLRELTSILGGPPDLRPELYNNDPWVEFIDLDIEEQSDRLADLDKDCFIHCSSSSNCTPLSISFRDDDSGRASCCDPDLHSDPEASPLHPLVQNENPEKETTMTCLKPCEPSSPPQSPVAVEPSFVIGGREALYTQVTEVRASGKVILSPEEQTEVEKTSGKDMEKDILAEKEKEKKELWLQVVNGDQEGYTSELNVGKTSPRSSAGDVSEPWQTCPAPSPCSLQEDDPTTPTSPLPPVPIYTVVEGVDMQNSLLLTPSSTPAPQLIIPKVVPTPDGYLTPDLLGSITP